MRITLLLSALLVVPGRAAAPSGGKVLSAVWQQADLMSRPRFFGELVKLRDGKVLYAGGMSEGAAAGLADTDLYDPATDTWTAGPRMLAGRNQFAAATLVDGRILVSGGKGPDGNIQNSAEIYDPMKGAWIKSAPMPSKREGHQLVTLHDGRVLAAGGNSGSISPTTTYIYDPKTDSWSDGGPMRSSHFHGRMQKLLSGKVLMAGGFGVSAAELYDPATNSWTAVAAMSAARAEHQMVVLPDGRALVSGGRGDGVLDSAEMFDPRAKTWTRTEPMSEQRFTHAMVVTEGAAIVIGGQSGSSSLQSTEIYEPSSNSWRQGPDLLGPRSYAASVVLDTGGVLTAGGRHGLGGGQNLNSSERLDAPGTFVPRKRPKQQPSIGRPNYNPEVIYRAPAPRIAQPSVEPLPPAGAARPNSHAVVIGVERYRETLPRADYAASDARRAAEYFKRVLGVPEENIAVLTDDRATKSDFEKYFERWLPNRVEKGDEVFVYFSGHGAPNPKSGESYLVPFDADPTYIEQTGYPVARLYAHLAKLKAKTVLVAMDSCFSGSGGRSVIARGARPLVTVVSSEVPAPLIVMSASAGDQISNTYQEKRQGLFTYFFLKGLAEKGDDYRGIFDYLKPQVTRVARRDYNSDQVPQWRKGR